MSFKFIVKKCKHHGNLTIDKIYVKTRPKLNKLFLWCKLCKQFIGRKYHQNNAERLNEKARKFYHNNKDYYSNRYKEDRKTEKGKLHRKKIKEKERINLGSSYVKTLLVSNGFAREDITDDLIQTKRALIKIKRIIKDRST